MSLAFVLACLSGSRTPHARHSRGRRRPDGFPEDPANGPNSLTFRGQQQGHARSAEKYKKMLKTVRPRRRTLIRGGKTDSTTVLSLAMLKIRWAHQKISPTIKDRLELTRPTLGLCPISDEIFM